MAKGKGLRILKAIFQLGIPIVRAALARRRAQPGDEIAANRELIDTTLEAADAAREKLRERRRR